MLDFIYKYGQATLKLNLYMYKSKVFLEIWDMYKLICCASK